jgi:hypothetical protein
MESLARLILFMGSGTLKPQGTLTAGRLIAVNGL